MYWYETTFSRKIQETKTGFEELEKFSCLVSQQNGLGVFVENRKITFVLNLL